MDLSDITRLISTLRAQTARDSITPNGLGSILQRIVDAISSMSSIDVEDEAAILQRLSAAESNASTALQAAQNAQAGAAGNVIDSFTQSQDEDEVSLSIKQHGHSARQVVLPAASSTGAGIMTATDKSHLDTAYGKRVNLMSAPSSESVVTLTITFGDGTTKSVTFVGATAGTGGKAGMMTKEQADQLAALVAAGTAENVRDDAGYLKQQYAAPVILRNVSDETIDDLSVGDIFYDTGKLWQCGTTENIDMGAPSKKVIYYCLADQTLYRWTGSRFVQAVSISSGDVTVPTKLSDLINDMGFLTAHQPLKTINGQTITGTGNITIDGAAELKDASSHIKQSVATPVVLRNVTDAVPDVLNIGDIYYDSGILWCYNTPSTHNLGAPSKNLVYFCLADNSFYRWTGSSFTQITTSGGGASEILALNGVSSNQDGTIVFTDTAGNTYTVNLNHTHENMAKLIVCEESDLPSTLDPATIYAQVNDADNPTEIEVLYIAGLEFTGGGLPAGTPAITEPRGTSINLGENSGSGVSKAIEIRANSHITGDLTVALASNSDLSFDTTNLPSGVTYNSGAGTLTIEKVPAMQGVNITIVYSGSGAAEIDGGLIITGGGASTKSVVVVVAGPQPIGVKLTGTQWLQTDYCPNANTEFELVCKFTDKGNTSMNNGYFLTCANNSDTTEKFQIAFSQNKYKLWHTVKAANTQGLDFSASADQANFVLDNSVLSFVKGTSNGTFKFVPGGDESKAKSISTPLMNYTMQNPLRIGRGNTYYFALFELTIYELTITENGTEVRHYVPKIVNGVPGLYDTKHDTFISSETAKTSGLATDELEAVYAQNNS